MPASPPAAGNASCERLTVSHIFVAVNSCVSHMFVAPLPSPLAILLIIYSNRLAYQRGIYYLFHCSGIFELLLMLLGAHLCRIYLICRISFVCLRFRTFLVHTNSAYVVTLIDLLSFRCELSICRLLLVAFWHYYDNKRNCVGSKTHYVREAYSVYHTSTFVASTSKKNPPNKNPIEQTTFYITKILYTHFSRC